LPEIESLVGSDAEIDAVNHPVTGPAAGDPRVLEERDVRPGAALLVCIEEVIDGRVILVDGLLHHAQPEHPDVELDIAGRIAGYRGDVVDTF
jgi:hypothetical protein